MSPSTSQTDMGSSGVPAGVLSPSNKPNTFVPLRRSNSFTNFFSSSRPSSPVKDSFEPPTSSAVQSPTKHSSSATHGEVQSDPVFAFLVLLDKKGRQKETFPIQNLKTTLGRSIENDVRFLASDVSRIHCTIEIEIQAAPEGNAAFLQVLGANGVLLNGVQALLLPVAKARTSSIRATRSSLPSDPSSSNSPRPLMWTQPSSRPNCSPRQSRDQAIGGSAYHSSRPAKARQDESGQCGSDRHTGSRVSQSSIAYKVPQRRQHRQGGTQGQRPPALHAVRQRQPLQGQKVGPSEPLFIHIHHRLVRHPAQEPHHKLPSPRPPHPSRSASASTPTPTRAGSAPSSR